MFAIMKAGASFVGMDPSHPKDRLLGIADQVQAKCILVSEDTRKLWNSQSQTMVVSASALNQSLPSPALKQTAVRRKAICYIHLREYRKA